MKRSIEILLVLIGTAFPLGCGGQTDPDNTSNATASNRSKPVSTNANGQVPPNEIVAMFSDSIRRGDKETTIKLITLAAREEIQRRGMTIDPPGSPEASYKIGEVRFLDQDRDAAYVESIWIEPGANGQPNQETEVVWAVQLEPEGWRISGLAIDMGPDQQPTLVDFENLEVDVVGSSAAPSSNVAGSTVPASTGFQAPPGSATNTAAPSPNGFTMPALDPPVSQLVPQLAQPPNTQLR